VCAAGLISALVLGVAVAPDPHGFELARGVPCTPVSSMLTAL
jgi:hypothetical protein